MSGLEIYADTRLPHEVRPTSVLTIKQVQLLRALIFFPLNLKVQWRFFLCCKRGSHAQ